ncbi:MAG TPA: SDR family oxidoreductase, partial [Polyangiaceae bacterium]|nr:SDR family oxidoreductase [Polyangiaceae bacterium]
MERLDVTRVFEGARLVVLGGTGFLGKVFWSMLLDRYPGFGRIYLVVRPKNGMSPAERFRSDIAGSDVLASVRGVLEEKVEPIDGDMGR